LAKEFYQQDIMLQGFEFVAPGYAGVTSMFLINKDVDIGSEDVGNNEWKHIVIVVDRTSVTSYVNGKRDGVKSINYDSGHFDIRNLWLGTTFQPYGSQYSDYFEGYLREVCVWDTILTQEQIETAFKIGVRQDLTNIL
jgi:hypothetical protein